MKADTPPPEQIATSLRKLRLAIERRRNPDRRKDEFDRAMVACKRQLEEAEKLPEGPDKLAAQLAAIELLSKDAPKKPDRRKTKRPSEPRPIRSS
jgi:hypothetical protein